MDVVSMKVSSNITDDNTSFSQELLTYKLILS